MTLLCKLLGHAMPTGYGYEAPYLAVGNIVIDGIGRHHAELRAVCRRCGEDYKAANIHIPQRYVKAVEEQKVNP